jgi:hypothetical protein
MEVTVCDEQEGALAMSVKGELTVALPVGLEIETAWAAGCVVEGEALGVPVPLDTGA